MGNGHPIAAVITTEAVAQSFYNTGIEYFNTYGGNPVSCAIASAVLDVLEDERLMDHAADLGLYIRSGFEDLAKRHEIIGDVRGVGMFVGVDLVRDKKTREPATKEAAHVTSRLREERILLQVDGPHNNVLKFKSPMVFNKKDADRLIRMVDSILAEIETMNSFD